MFFYIIGGEIKKCIEANGDNVTEVVIMQLEKYSEVETRVKNSQCNQVFSVKKTQYSGVLGQNT